jgi:hypothetical protein
MMSQPENSTPSAVTDPTAWLAGLFLHTLGLWIPAPDAKALGDQLAPLEWLDRVLRCIDLLRRPLEVRGDPDDQVRLDHLAALTVQLLSIGAALDPDGSAGDGAIWDPPAGRRPALTMQDGFLLATLPTADRPTFYEPIAHVVYRLQEFAWSRGALPYIPTLYPQMIAYPWVPGDRLDEKRWRADQLAYLPGAFRWFLSPWLSLEEADAFFAALDDPRETLARLVRIAALAPVQEQLKGPAPGDQAERIATAAEWLLLMGRAMDLADWPRVAAPGPRWSEEHDGRLLDRLGMLGVVYLEPTDVLVQDLTAWLEGRGKLAGIEAGWTPGGDWIFPERV